MSKMRFCPSIFRLARADFYHEADTMLPAARQADWVTLKAHGFDAVWFHSVLREVCPTALFAPFQPGHQKRLEALRATVQLAGQAGMGVWLYLNEPRGLPADHPFWAAHPECAGDTGACLMSGAGQTRALCTSQPRVMEFLREATIQLCGAVPELAGMFVITASEYHTHCFSHCPLEGPAAQTDCPHCAGHNRAQVVAEILNQLAAGIAQAGTKTKLAAWTWSWARHIEPDPQPGIITRLRPAIALLSDFERGLPARRAGHELMVDEYSLAVTGPSRRFQDHATQAHQTQRDLLAKLQLNTTHELATVPNLPVPGRLYDKLAAMQSMGVTGCLASWNFGLFPTLNTFAYGFFQQDRTQTKPVFLEQLARAYFSLEVDVNQVLQAWEGFERALDAHPLVEPFIYFSPLCYAPAYPLKTAFAQTPLGPSWLEHPWGDRLEDSLGPYNLDEMITLLDQLTTRWEAACETYTQALKFTTGQSKSVDEERNSAFAAGHFFRSCRNVYRWYAAWRDHDHHALQETAADELEHLPKLINILEADDRIGLHQECGRRYVTAEKVQEKLVDLSKLMLMGGQTLAH